MLLQLQVHKMLQTMEHMLHLLMQMHVLLVSRKMHQLQMFLQMQTQRMTKNSRYSVKRRVFGRTSNVKNIIKVQ